MTLADRLKWALEYAHMKPIALAQAARVQRGTVSLWVNGQTQSIDGANLVRVAKALGVSPFWLATGEGQRIEAPTILEQELLQEFGSLTEEHQRLVLHTVKSMGDHLRNPPIGDPPRKRHVERN